MFLPLKYLCKFTELPESIECCKLIKDNMNHLFNRNWSSFTIKLFMLRATDKLRILNLTNIPFNHTAIIYHIPTWYDMEELCRSVFSNVTVDKLSDTVANQVFNSIHEKYNPDVYIFTDESRIESPEISCSAGVVVNQGNTKMMNYRLPPENSIMGCELYAIEQALIHVSDLLNGQEIKSEYIQIFLAVYKL